MKFSTPRFVACSQLFWGALASMALLAACSPSDSTPRGAKASVAASSLGLGQRISEGTARNLKASGDGKHLAFVTSLNDVPDKTASGQIRMGNLAVASVEKGLHRVVGRGVSTLSDAFAFSPDSAHIAFLENFNLAKGKGALKVTSLSQEGGDASPDALASDVDFFGFSPDSALVAYVAPDGLHLRTLTTASDQLLDTGVASFEFSMDGQFLAYRKSSARGGELLLAKRAPDGSFSLQGKVASFAGDYAFSKDSRFLALTARGSDPSEPYQTLVVDLFAKALSTVFLGNEAGNFVFSKDSKTLAFVANQTPGMPYGELFLVPLASPLPQDLGARSVKVGTSVADFRFSPTSQAIALRENHRDERGRMWQTLGVWSVPEGKKLFHQSALPNAFISYLFSLGGEEFAFVKHVKADVNLWRVPLKSASAKPSLVAPWTYQYRFFDRDGVEGAQDTELFFLGDCIREGRECVLYAAQNTQVSAGEKVEVSGADSKAKDAAQDHSDESSLPSPSEKTPEESRPKPAPSRPIASSISSFVTPPQAPKRLFFNLPRLDTMDAFDLAHMDLDSAGNGGDVHSVDRSVLKDSLVFLDPEGRQIAYVVSDRKRSGVYVAKVE